MARVLFVGLLCVVAATAQMQPNCASLPNAGDIRGNSSNPLMAMRGDNLPYCRNSSLQCCTAEYLRRRGQQLNESILAGLRDQLQGNLEPLMNAQDLMEEYINNQFINQFIRALPIIRLQNNLPGRDVFINNFARQLRMNFMINGTTARFNVSEYFRGLTDSLTMLIVRFVDNSTSLNATQRACITREFNSVINRTTIQMVIGNVEQLRRVSSSLSRILQWYRYNFTQDLAGFRPLAQCAERLITLRCAACNRDIPQLCRPSCSALIRGCLSPFQSGLDAQLNILWNVTRQIVNRGVAILRDVGESDGMFLNVDLSTPGRLLQYGSQVAARCGISSSSGGMMGRRRRQMNNQNMMMFRPPEGVMTNVTRLAGVFNYGSNGPAFCRSRPIARCWNGMRTVDRDTINFNSDLIRDQARNPVLAFNVNDLNRQAMNLGTPVSDYLMTEDFDTVVPREVTVPEGEAFMPGSASMIKAAPLLLLLLFAALVALF